MKIRASVFLLIMFNIPFLASAEIQNPVVRMCSRLLALEESQFNFDVFEAAKAKYRKQHITVDEFARYQTMAPEELMALIELNAQRSDYLNQGLQFGKLSARKRVALLTAVESLQKTKKNVYSNIRKLMTLWSSLTAEKPTSRYQKVISRLDPELAARATIRLFREAGIKDRPSWWEIEKRDLKEHNNVTQWVVAALLTGPTSSTGVPLIVLPMLDFVTASQLADEYEAVVEKLGPDEARDYVATTYLNANAANSFMRSVVSKTNIALLVAAVAFNNYQYYEFRQANNEVMVEKIYGAMNAPADNRQKAEKLNDFSDDMYVGTIQLIEEHSGKKMTPEQKAQLRHDLDEAAKAESNS